MTNGSPRVLVILLIPCLLTSMVWAGWPGFASERPGTAASDQFSEQALNPMGMMTVGYLGTRKTDAVIKQDAGFLKRWNMVFDPAGPNPLITPTRVGDTGGTIDGEILRAERLWKAQHWTAGQAIESIAAAFQAAEEPEFVTRLQTAIDLLKFVNPPGWSDFVRLLERYTRTRADHSRLPVDAKRELQKIRLRSFLVDFSPNLFGYREGGDPEWLTSFLKSTLKKPIKGGKKQARLLRAIFIRRIVEGKSRKITANELKMHTDTVLRYERVMAGTLHGFALAAQEKTMPSLWNRDLRGLKGSETIALELRDAGIVTVGDLVTAVRRDGLPRLSWKQKVDLQRVLRENKLLDHAESGKPDPADMGIERLNLSIRAERVIDAIRAGPFFTNRHVMEFLESLSGRRMSVYPQLGTKTFNEIVLKLARIGVFPMKDSAARRLISESA